MIQDEEIYFDASSENKEMTGILVIDKPPGLTSHDVVDRIRRMLGVRKIGHTGTLDPFATGVLVILVGRATRLMQFLVGADKEYEAVIRLGYSTDTGDLMGHPLINVSELVFDWKSLSNEQIEAALESLRGEIEQIPPMYSAKKLEGKKLYELARKGIQVERKPVKVHIYEFKAIAKDGVLLRSDQTDVCDLLTHVACSSGTYIRVLAESLGSLLGVGAHLSALRRTRVGHLKIEDAITLDDLKRDLETKSIKDLILSCDRVLSHIPFVHLTDSQVQQTRNGVAVKMKLDGFENGQLVRMRDAHEELVAIGVYSSDNGSLHPKVCIAS
jgi:tRNA pseudouridine55 synthase